MTTRFRAGDVVQMGVSVLGAGVRYEERVEDTCSHSIRTQNGWADGRDFRLLRRPLLVGDVLQLEGTSETQKVNDYVVRNAAAWVRGGWTHEDGTPIDVEAPAVEAKLDPPLGGNNSHGVGGAEREAEVQNAYNQRNNERAAAMMGAGAQAEIQSIQRAIQDAHQGINAQNMQQSKRKQINHDHCVSIDLHRKTDEQATEAVARANRLSDECGALASQNRELLAENATLRRDVERLMRKARR